MSRNKKIVAISIVTSLIASATFAGCTTHSPSSEVDVSSEQSFYVAKNDETFKSESARNDELISTLSESHSNTELSETVESSIFESSSQATSETPSTSEETSAHEETSIYEESPIDVSDTSETLSEDFSDEASNEVSDEEPNEVSDESIEVTSEHESTSILCYGICKQDCTILIEDGSYDELYKGQQVAILRNLDDTYQILWYKSTAKVDATCLQLFSSDFVPDFSKGQWAGCITN